MHKLFYSLLILLIFFTSIKDTSAVYNPLTYPNNKYGIHIIDENDLDNAAALVNSSGGDWGYVKMVITQDDRNVDKWQGIFDKFSRLHLIPIIRIATKAESDYWLKPYFEDGVNWANFLSSLRWPTKNNYIILFNEPNHAKEWGNTIDPVEYARIVISYSEQFKNSSDDIFILSAGLDASAPDGRITMDEVSFLKKIYNEAPEYFASIDGWTSHSYPNPGFIGKVEKTGRGSLRTYLWEKELIQKLGVTKIYPVFITETGWPHSEGYPNSNYYSPDILVEMIDRASQIVWNDNDIVAITPFVLNYQSLPFINFSWQRLNEDSFYPHFDAYKAIPKIAGKPVLLEYVEKNGNSVLTEFKKNDYEANNLSLWHKIVNFLAKQMLIIFKV